MANTTDITEGDILERIISSAEGTLTPSVARSLLGLRFPAQDTARIRRLLRKNNAGTIAAGERMILEKYLRIGQFLDLLHARARLSLAKRSQAR